MKQKRTVHVYVVSSDYGVDTFTNLTKLIKAYSNLSYRKVYYSITQHKEYKKDGWKVNKTVLR